MQSSLEQFEKIVFNAQLAFWSWFLQDFPNFFNAVGRAQGEALDKGEHLVALTLTFLNQFR